MYKDIIERAIEQFAAGIAYVLKLRAEKKEEKAFQYIQEELLKYLGLKTENLLNLPEALGLQLIDKKCENNSDLKIYISDLICHQAEMKLENGSMDESRKLFKIALNIIVSLNPDGSKKSKNRILKKISYLKKMTG